MFRSKSIFNSPVNNYEITFSAGFSPHGIYSYRRIRAISRTATPSNNAARHHNKHVAPSRRRNPCTETNTNAHNRWLRQPVVTDKQSEPPWAQLCTDKEQDRRSEAYDAGSAANYRVVRTGSVS